MAGVYDTCAHCGASQKHAPGRGKARKYCGHECQAAANAQRWASRPISTCCIAGCSGSGTRAGRTMCEMHYVRTRRNGTTDYIGN